MLMVRDISKDNSPQWGVTRGRPPPLMDGGENVGGGGGGGGGEINYHSHHPAQILASNIGTIALTDSMSYHHHNQQVPQNTR